MKKRLDILRLKTEGSLNGKSSIVAQYSVVEVLHKRSPLQSPTYQYNRPDLGRPDSQHRPDPGTRPEHSPDPGTSPEKPPHVPPRAPIKPDKLYENVAKLQPTNFGR